MSSIAKYATLAALLFGVTACGDTWGQRAVTGGGIGAGSGALLGVATGFNPLLGAVCGDHAAALLVPLSFPRQPDSCRSVNRAGATSAVRELQT